jgi:hypothetical protein
MTWWKPLVSGGSGAATGAAMGGPLGAAIGGGLGLLGGLFGGGGDDKKQPPGLMPRMQSGFPLRPEVDPGPELIDISQPPAQQAPIPPQQATQPGFFGDPFSPSGDPYANPFGALGQAVTEDPMSPAAQQMWVGAGRGIGNLVGQGLSSLLRR